jgi:choline-sulfatase
MSRKRRQAARPNAEAAGEAGTGPGRPGRHGARLLVLLALVGLGAVAALWLADRPHPVRGEPGLSVLLVTIDTLRADALGSYGNRSAETPWIDRLAAGGWRFDFAHAHNVVTLPSHANILSGRYPFEHGLRDNSGFRFPDGMDTLATLLKAQGYRTGAFVSAFPLDSRFGLARGFDVYDDRIADLSMNHGFRMDERPGGETVAAARRWLDAQGDAPTFCWVHLYEPHAPYAPPEPWASRFRDPYQGEVATTDALLQPLVAPLLAAGDRGRTLVVLTSDHGEGLGDHGEMTHGIFAYEATLRVPLILFQPRVLGRPRVVPEPAGHVDILPTVLDAVSVSSPPGLPGRSLLAPRDAPSPTYFEALSASLNRGWAPLHGVIRDHVKYVDLPLPEAYDLAADPAESRNLAPRQPQLLEDLRGLLSRLRRADRGPQRGAETAETRERLRALGYVSSTAPEKQRYTEADDPKRLVDLDNAIHDVVMRYGKGDVLGALALCRDVVRRRPGMALAQSHLAYLLRAAGDLPGAVEAARAAVEASPADTDAAALLGAYLTESGHAASSVELLAPYARKSDPDLDVLIALGVAQATIGRTREALATFGRVKELDPTNAMALVNIGTVHLMGGDLAQARRDFEGALELNPFVARAQNSLGVIAAREGRVEEALEHWRRAAELDPRDSQALFNLGTTLLRLGRAQEARRWLERYLKVAPAGESRESAEIQEIVRQQSKPPDPSTILKKEPRGRQR